MAIGEPNVFPDDDTFPSLLTYPFYSDIWFPPPLFAAYSGPSSERILEEESVEKRGLPVLAASYPYEPESYWAAVDARIERNRVQRPAPPKAVW